MSGSIRVGENKHSFRTHSTAMYWSLHSEELMHSRTTWNEGQQRVCVVEHARRYTEPSPSWLTLTSSSTSFDSTSSFDDRTSNTTAPHCVARSHYTSTSSQATTVHFFNGWASDSLVRCCSAHGFVRTISGGQSSAYDNNQYAAASQRTSRNHLVPRTVKLHSAPYLERLWVHCRLFPNSWR